MQTACKLLATRLFGSASAPCMMCVHCVLEHARPRVSAVCALASGRFCALCTGSCVPLLPPDSHARGLLDHRRFAVRLACWAVFLEQVDLRTSSGSCGRSGSRTSRSHTQAQAERLSERIMWKAGTMHNDVSTAPLYVVQ